MTNVYRKAAPKPFEPVEVPEKPKKEPMSSVAKNRIFSAATIVATALLVNICAFAFGHNYNYIGGNAMALSAIVGLLCLGSRIAAVDGLHWPYKTEGER